MNIFSPKKFPRTDNLSLRLQFLVESENYIYVGNNGKICSFVIDNGILETRGVRKNAKVCNALKVFNEITFFLGIYENEMIYIYDILFFEGEDLRDLPTIKRLRKIKDIVEKINDPRVVSASFYSVKKSFYNYLGFTLKNKHEYVLILDKNACYDIKYATLIDKSFLTEFEGTIVSYTEFNEPIKIPNDKIESWEYWMDLRTNKKLKGFYFKDYVYATKILEPISESHYNSDRAVAIKLLDGRVIKIYSNKKINEKVKIGCIEYDNKIIHPFLMED